MKRFMFNLSRQQLLVALAYGLFLACTSVMLWGGYVGFLPSEVTDSGYVPIDYFARGIAFPASLFIAGAVAYRKPRSERWRSPWIALALFVTGGALLLGQSVIGLYGEVGSGAQSADGGFPVLAVALGVCFGWGSGLMFCALQQVVAAQKVFEAGIIVFSAAGISALIFFLIEALPHKIVPWIAFAVLVPLTVIVLQIARRQVALVHPMFETVPRQRRDRCREAAVELWRPLLCIAFSAFIVGLIRIDSLADGFLLRQVNVSNMIGLLIASVVLLATWRIIYRTIGLTKLYLVLFPLTATAFLLLPLLDGSFRALSVSIVFLVFSITSSFMVISCARTARSQCLPPVLVYGLFAGVVYGFSLVGSLVGMLGETIGGGSLQLPVIALAAIYVLSLAMTMQRRRKETRSANRSTVQGDVGGSTDTSAATGAIASDASAVEAGGSLSESTIAARCGVLVTRYGLTPREADVLALLARGRDVPFIAEELVISKNTVRSHTKSIFAKIGVHARQELINLIEQTEL